MGKTIKRLSRNFKIGNGKLINTSFTSEDI